MGGWSGGGSESGAGGGGGGSGENTGLDPQLWHACAGGLVQLPPAGAKVIYFPQGHGEQATTPPEFPRVMGTGSTGTIPCRVMSVNFLADTETDEVYARMRLQTLPQDPSAQSSHSNSSVDATDAAGPASPPPEKTNSFSKILTPSDTNTFGGFAIPRRGAETIFPPLDYSIDPPAQTIVVKDVHGEKWEFCHLFRGRRHLLTTGWSTFMKEKKLVAGDVAVFLKSASGEVCVGVRRSMRGTGGSDSLNWSGGSPSTSHHRPNRWEVKGSDVYSDVFTGDSAAGSSSASSSSASGGAATRGQGGLGTGPGIGMLGPSTSSSFARNRARVTAQSVLDAASLALSGQPFEVVYYPRASTAEFCVKEQSVKAALEQHWFPGMRFKMAFETEDSSRIRWFMGTINLVQACDPLWPKSPWRILQVNWDLDRAAPDLLQGVSRVSPWQVEVVEVVSALRASEPAKLNLPGQRLMAMPMATMSPVFGQADHHPNNPWPYRAIYDVSAGMQGARDERLFGLALSELEPYRPNKMQAGGYFSSDAFYHPEPPGRNTNSGSESAGFFPMSYAPASPYPSFQGRGNNPPSDSSNSIVGKKHPRPDPRGKFVQDDHQHGPPWAAAGVTTTSTSNSKSSTPSSTSLTLSGYASLMAALHPNNVMVLSDLKELHIARTGFVEIRGSAGILARAIESGSLKNLETLDLSDSLIYTGFLFSSMRKKHGMPLRQLILRNCSLIDELVIQLAAALASGNLSRLHKLDLSGNCALRDESMICIAASLAAGHAPHLTDFLWEYTTLGDDGVHELARAIRSGYLSRLEKLKLSRNFRISDSSVVSLTEAFGSEQGLFLKEWSLSGTGVGDDGVALLASLVASGNLISHEKLDLSGCHKVSRKCKEMFPDFFLTAQVTPPSDVMGSASKTGDEYGSLLRCDVGSLGFKWDQKYDSQRILLLCDLRKTVDQGAQFLFFHVKGMAEFVGVGIAYSKVSVKRESFGYRAVVRELTRECWKGYWSEALSRTGLFKPILLKKEASFVTPPAEPPASSSAISSCTELHLTKGEALAKFGVCIDGTDGQHYFNVSEFPLATPEEPSKLQNSSMKWFEDVIDHLQRGDGSACAQHGLESLVVNDSSDEPKEGHGTEEQPFLDDSDDQLPPRNLEQMECGEEAIGGESYISRWSNIPNHAYEKSVPESSGTNGDGSQPVDREEIRGATCKLAQGRGGKRKQSLQGDGFSGSIGVQGGANAKVRVQEVRNDRQRAKLIVHVNFNPSNCKYYRLNSETEKKEPMPSALPGVPPTRLPKSDIEPELIVEFLCKSAQSDGLNQPPNQLSTTLKAQYSIQSEKNDRPLGWSQDNLGLSFRSSKKENAPCCASVSPVILSPVVPKTQEFTRQSETTKSALMDRHLAAGFWTLQGGARAESTCTHNVSDTSASKVEQYCLSKHPTFAIRNTSKPRKLAYKAHSLNEPVAPSDPLWRQVKGTGLYSTVTVDVNGKWNLYGEGEKKYEFKVRKELSKCSAIENGAAVPNTTSSSNTNGRDEGQQSDEESTVWQILRREFIVNHNFSQFFNRLKRSDPYEWTLLDPLESDGPVPDVLKPRRE